MKRPRKPTKSGHGMELKTAQLMDDLSEFDKFRADIMPILRKAILEKWPPDRIYREFAAHAAARSVTIALTEEDPSRALSAIQEVLNRGYGKATEKREVTNRFENLKDEDLDNLILSEISENRDGH